MCMQAHNISAHGKEMEFLVRLSATHFYVTIDDMYTETLIWHKEEAPSVV